MKQLDRVLFHFYRSFVFSLVPFIVVFLPCSMAAIERQRQARTINICYIFRQDNATAGPRIGRGDGRRGGMGGGGGGGGMRGGGGGGGKEDPGGGGGARGGHGVTQTALILGKVEL